jgi:hypothetical protein
VLKGWRWQSACRTELQNIIFSQDNKLYRYAFDDKMRNADYVGDTAYSADGSGIPINFDWEMPWTDLKHRMSLKYIRYLGLDTTGSARFTVRAYVDNLYSYQGVDSPLLSMDFVGGTAGGYGGSQYGDGPYGGGRRTSDERLFGYIAKFKLLKLRFSGSTKTPLRFISVSLGYVAGSIRR